MGTLFWTSGKTCLSKGTGSAFKGGGLQRDGLKAVHVLFFLLCSVLFCDFASLLLCPAHLFSLIFSYVLFLSLLFPSFSFPVLPFPPLLPSLSVGL